MAIPKDKIYRLLIEAGYDISDDNILKYMEAIIKEARESENIPYCPICKEELIITQRKVIVKVYKWDISIGNFKVTENFDYEEIPTCQNCGFEIPGIIE